MLRFFTLLFTLLLLLSSCQDEKQQEIQLREAKKKEQIFASVNAHWKFHAQPMNPPSQELTATWAPWRDLLRELGQKPQSSIEAFQKKAKVLSVKARELSTQVPSPYDKPEVKSRLAVLTAKINSLDLFLSLDDIPAEKVNREVDAINACLTSLQQQFDEIVRKSRIPTEQGESDLIRMLDTTRAVPTGGVFPESSAKPQQPATPQRNMPPRAQLKPGSGQMKKIASPQ